MTSQLELHYLEDTDNEIVFRAREMSEMVNEMYLFTRLVLSDTYCITNVCLWYQLVNIFFFHKELMHALYAT